MVRTAWGSAILACWLLSVAGCRSPEQEAFFRDVEANNLYKVRSELKREPGWLNDRNVDGRTPLCLAAYRGRDEMAEWLIQAGADVDAADSLGRTPLYWSAAQNKRKTAEQLLARGAEVDARDEWGRTPLQVAVANGHRETAALLIARGADVNAQDRDGHRPLFWAVTNGHRQLAEMLRKQGAEQ